MKTIQAWLAACIFLFSVPVFAATASDPFEEVVAKYLAANPKPLLPEEARKYKVQAEFALEQKRYPQAAQLYANALEIAPWWPAGHFNRALIMAELKDYREAMLEMTRYLLLEPSAPDACTVQDKIYQWELVAQPTAAGSVFKDCDVCPEMVVIPAGTFMMGSPASERERDSNEGPQHQVTIARPFAAGKFEVTFEEWDACVRESGCDHKPGDVGWGRGRRPVINVSWNDAKQYMQWLSRKTGRNYRLLTEAEWEYAARAGTTTQYYWGDSDSDSCQYANASTGIFSSGDCRMGKTSPVGSRKPNAFGLYDMAGNVWEWTEDCMNANYQGAPSDGSSRTSGDDCGRRVLRGGSWDYLPGGLRSALRNGSTVTPSLRRHLFVGFRAARTQ